MKKITFFLIPIYIISCFIESYKTLYTNDTIETRIKVLELDTITTPTNVLLIVKTTQGQYTKIIGISEEEAWKKFDTFWIEFQNVVINKDTNKFKEMCQIEESWSCEEIIEWLFLNVCFKRMIKSMNKENNYTYNKYIPGYSKYKDNCIYIINENEEYINFDLKFRFINGKYKLVECYGSYPKFSN